MAGGYIMETFLGRKTQLCLPVTILWVLLVPGVIRWNQFQGIGSKEVSQCQSVF